MNLLKWSASFLFGLLLIISLWLLHSPLAFFTTNGYDWAPSNPKEVYSFLISGSCRPFSIKPYWDYKITNVICEL